MPGEVAYDSNLMQACMLNVSGVGRKDHALLKVKCQAACLLAHKWPPQPIRKPCHIVFRSGSLL